MKQWITALVVAAAVVGSGSASAQDPPTGAHRFEITGFPGGGILFTKGSSSSDEADFTNYALGGSLTYNLNRYWGVEGEFGGAFGVDQRINFANSPSVGDASPPDLLAFQGNALVYPAGNDRRLVPYGTAGIGSLTMFEKADFGLDGDETFLTTNAGAVHESLRG